MQLVWRLFLNASSQLGNIETFRNDLVDVTRQCLQDVAFLFYLRLMTAYNVTKNITAFNQIATQIMNLLNDTDTVLMTQKPFLLGPWLESAKNWGTFTFSK
jgi:alpha-N-acetylglucosaminidase